MIKEKQIDYKAYANSMRADAVKDAYGNIICHPDLWEEIATIIESVAVYRENLDIAREIFEEIEKILTSLDNRHMLCGNPKQAWGVRSVAIEIEKLKEKYAPDTNVGCNTEGKR